MRMYVHQNHIRMRLHSDEHSPAMVNRISEIMAENFPDTFDNNRSGLTKLKNERLVMKWAFGHREAVIEAADVILDYFEQERRNDVIVRFCLPDCGPELWPGEWFVKELISEPDGDVSAGSAPESAEQQQARAEFMERCNAQHPEGWLGAARDIELRRQVIYEAWQNSANRKPVAEFFSRVTFWFFAPFR